MGIIDEVNNFYFRTIRFEQSDNPVFQLQQYHSILVPEWCCASRVLAWESHWHQLCVWPTIVQVMGFYTKKNAWDIRKLLYSRTGGCITYERKGMHFFLVYLIFYLCFFIFIQWSREWWKFYSVSIWLNTYIWILTFQRQCNKCLGLHDLQFYFNIIDRKCYVKLPKNIWRLNQV